MGEDLNIKKSKVCRFCVSKCARVLFSPRPLGIKISALFQNFHYRSNKNLPMYFYPLHAHASFLTFQFPFCFRDHVSKCRTLPRPSNSSFPLSFTCSFAPKILRPRSRIRKTFQFHSFRSHSLISFVLSNQNLAPAYPNSKYSGTPRTIQYRRFGVPGEGGRAYSKRSK